MKVGSIVETVGDFEDARLKCPIKMPNRPLDIIGHKLDEDAVFIECNEVFCEKCRYYKATSDNVCIQNCERLGLTGYYK